MESRRVSTVLLVLALVFSPILPGCTGPLVHLAEIEPGDIDASKYEVVGDGEGSASGFIILGVLGLSTENQVERAVQAAIADKGGDELINVKIQEKGGYFFLFQYQKTTVSGTVIKRK